MIYMADKNGELKIVILETGNIEELMKGRPAISPDKSVMIAWTPDPVWLADKLMDTNGDTAAIAKLIDQSAKRKQTPVNRPKHKPYLKSFLGEQQCDG